MRPPRLPASHPSTGFRLSIGDDSPIVLALEAAGAVIGTDERRDELAGEVNGALLRFIHARDEGTPQARFHEEIKRLRAALAGILEVLPGFDPVLPLAGSPLSVALVEEWSRGALSRALLDHPEGGVDEFGGEWRFVFPHPAAFEGLRHGLTTLDQAAASLAVAEQVGCKGRPPYREDQALVRELHSIFEQATSRPARQGRRKQGAQLEPRDQRTRAGGPFGTFVRAVDDELFGALVTVFMTQPVARDGDRKRAMTSAEAEAEAGKYRLRGIAAMIATSVQENGSESAD